MLIIMISRMSEIPMAEMEYQYKYFSAILCKLRKQILSVKGSSERPPGDGLFPIRQRIAVSPSLIPDGNPVSFKKLLLKFLEAAAVGGSVGKDFPKGFLLRLKFGSTGL